jgi:hypothetical protein
MPHDKKEINRRSSQKYYEKNKSALNAARREKYKSDEGYRKKCIECSKKRYKQICDDPEKKTYYERNKEAIKKKNLERYHRNKKKTEAEEAPSE